MFTFPNHPKNSATMKRTPPQNLTTPSASMATPSERFYTPSEVEEIIPATQYTQTDTQTDTQTAKPKQSQEQLTHLMQSLEDAIAETKRLKPQGNNALITRNILLFLQEAMSTGQKLTALISKLESNQGTQNDTTPKATQEEPTVQAMAAQIAQMSKDITEMKTLVTNTKTWAQVVANENRTENDGSVNKHRKLRVQRTDQVKEEAAKYSIKLLATNALDEVKKRLTEMTHKELIDQLQNAINKQYTNNPPKLLPGMTKNDKDTY